MWNSTAKQLKFFFFENYQVKFDPFNDVEFKCARAARDAKRRELQRDPEKRKKSAAVLRGEDYKEILNIWDEDTPNGLQKKIFYIASHELAWRGGEGAAAKIEHFTKEFDTKNNFTGRIEYNPIFTKTTQGGSKKLSDSKWLIKNTQNPEVCPVRLFHKLIEKRGNSIQVDRLFLTPNPNWTSSNWFKNCPVGRNTMSTWFKEAATKVGIDTKKVKITNHSARATAVSNLAKKGVSEQQLIKITGHSNSQSIKPYLQMDTEHHHNVVNAMRSEIKSVEKGEQSTASSEASTSRSTSSIGLEPEFHKQISNNNNSNGIVYNNCIFNITNHY